MKASDYLGSKYVTAAELPTDRHITAVITGVSEETMLLSNDVKLVLALRNTAGKPWPRGIVLNKGNGMQLVTAYGDDCDDWIGKRIEVWAAPTTFGGRSVMGIRLVGISAAAPPARAPAQPAKPTGGPSWDAPQSDDDLDDAIPF